MPWKYGRRHKPRNFDPDLVIGKFPRDCTLDCRHFYTDVLENPNVKTTFSPNCTFCFCDLILESKGVPLNSEEYPNILCPLGRHIKVGRRQAMGKTKEAEVRRLEKVESMRSSDEERERLEKEHIKRQKKWAKENQKRLKKIAAEHKVAAREWVIMQRELEKLRAEVALPPEPKKKGRKKKRKWTRRIS